MIGLAELERRVRGDGAFDLIEKSHLHRATLEEGSGLWRGRTAIRDRRMSDVAAGGGGPVAIDMDLGEMIAITTAGGWRAHRWGLRQGERILQDILIEDGAARRRLAPSGPAQGEARSRSILPAHPIFGETRSGRGQLAVAALPDLPVGFPMGARHCAELLHRRWNGRHLVAGPAAWIGPDAQVGDDDLHVAWLLELLVLLPDARLLIQRAIVQKQHVAILWRLHAHHLEDAFGARATGRPIRAVGSSLFTVATDGGITAEDTMLDMVALEAEIGRRPIAYGFEGP